MANLVGYWTEASGWAYAFKEDGSGFLEFRHIILLQYRTIRWNAKGEMLEILSEVEYSRDASEAPFTAEAHSYRAAFPFRIMGKETDGRTMRTLSLDLLNAEVPDVDRLYHPSEFTCRDQIQVGATYHPEQAR